MIVIQQEDRRVIVNVYGEFSLADFKEFEAAVHSKVGFEGPVDLLFDLREMVDFTVDVAWEDIVFARAHPHDFRRIAVITRSQWVAWSAWLTRIFVEADLKVFDEAADAQSWLEAVTEDEESV